MTDWIDVSVSVRNGMAHWPGDPAYHIQHVENQNKGDVHVVSLEAGIWATEGLDLGGVEAGLYEMICLPLNLIGAKRAPARAGSPKRARTTDTLRAAAAEKFSSLCGHTPRPVRSRSIE